MVVVVVLLLLLRWWWRLPRKAAEVAVVAVVVAAPCLRIIPESYPKHTRTMPATLAGCPESIAWTRIEGKAILAQLLKFE